MKRRILSSLLVLAGLGTSLSAQIGEPQQPVSSGHSDHKGIPDPSLPGIDPFGLDLDVPNKGLLFSIFRTNNVPRIATCATAGCVAPATGIFTPAALAVTCPAPGPCNFYIHLESQVHISQSDDGLFKFLVDGVAPFPGPTDGSGFLAWLINDPFSAVRLNEARSFAVVAHVSPGTHLVEVDIDCFDFSAPAGCSASAGFSTLRIDVYKP